MVLARRTDSAGVKRIPTVPAHARPAVLCARRQPAFGAANARFSWTGGSFDVGQSLCIDYLRAVQGRATNFPKGLEIKAHTTACACICVLKRTLAVRVR